MNNNIAILGDGQLASMLIEYAGCTNLKFFSLENTINFKNDSTVISYWIQKLYCYDVITYENENISVKFLELLCKNKLIYPNLEILNITQDRLKEKNMLKNLKILTNLYYPITSYLSFLKLTNYLIFPFIVKTRRFGYDGKGQSTIETKKDINDMWFKKKPNIDLISEEKINFSFEVSQIVSRDKFGNIEFYSLLKNDHRCGILRKTTILNQTITNVIFLVPQIKLSTIKILKYFDYVGILTIEFFVKNNLLYANELAPRVHNSGHWSINGAVTSQFTNHILCIRGNQVSSAKNIYNYIFMINLIGEMMPLILFKQLKQNNLKIFIKTYNKTLKYNRKLGHIVIVANDILNITKIVKNFF